jgi:hypothetical protein
MTGQKPDKPLELPEAYMRPVKFYKQDGLHRERLSIKWSDGTEIPTDLAGIEGLEKAAIWAPEHVEDRIADHFAARPNKWLKSLALQGEGSSQKEFNDRMNDPSKYQLEDPSSNRSRRYEKRPE